MTLRRLSGDCDDDWTCPGLWEDDEHVDDLVAVGELLDPAPVPLGDGEVAVRLSRRVVRDARIG